MGASVFESTPLAWGCCESSRHPTDDKGCARLPTEGSLVADIAAENVRNENG